jgi:hypothetical protein
MVQNDLKTFMNLFGSEGKKRVCGIQRKLLLTTIMRSCRARYQQ